MPFGNILMYNMLRKLVVLNMDGKNDPEEGYLDLLKLFFLV